MREPLKEFYRFLDTPIQGAARILLIVLLVPLGLSYTRPLWHINMVAPQYPQGLNLYIYSYKLEGGRGGADVPEINTLNHYIGMRKIDRETLTELDWLPFVFGALGLLVLRVAALGNVRMLIDLTVLTMYVSAFGLARFYLKMHSFGHTLDPQAPFKMEPFTPVVFGTAQVANFTTTAYPSAGSIYMAVFGTGVAAVLLWHLVAGRIRAARAQRAV
jgi:hypothetical protein